MITLPKEWANSVGLKKNDTVGVQAQPDGTLLLYPRDTMPAPKRSTKVIDATGVKDHSFFYRQLVGAYISGHTTILIKSVQPISSSLMSVVTTFVQTAVGLEMIEADDSHVLIANLIEHDAIDPKKSIERMRILIKNMMHDLYEAAYAGDMKVIKDMSSRDTDVDRIYWLTARQYNIYQRDISAPNELGIPLHEMSGCFFMARVLESVGDLLVSLSECLASVEKGKEVDSADENAHRIGLKTIDVLMAAVKSWTNTDITMAEQSLREAEKIIKEIDKNLFKNAEKSDSFTCSSEIAFFSSRRIAEHTMSIGEFAFNLAMK